MEIVEKLESENDIDKLIEQAIIQWEMESDGESKSYDYSSIIANLSLLTKKPLELFRVLDDEVYIDADVYAYYRLTDSSIRLKKKIDPNFMKNLEIEKAPISTESNWATFKMLLQYYIKCVRIQARPQYYMHPDKEGINYYIPKSLPVNWLRGLDDENEEIIVQFEKKGTPIKAAILANEDSDNIVYLGYPILASFNRETGLPDYFTPLSLIPIKYKLDSKDPKALHSDKLAMELDIENVMLNQEWFDRSIPDDTINDINRLIELKVAASKHPEAAIDLKNSMQEILASSVYAKDGEFNPNNLMQILPIVKSQRKSYKQVCNTAIFFKASDFSYTKNLIRELSALEKMSPSDLDKTSLAYIFREPAFKCNSIDNKLPIPFIESNGEQLDSIDKTINYPLATIQGPPGTGKSQVAVNIIANCIYNGETILFSSKNHNAVNAIKERSEKLLGNDIPLVQFCADDQNIRTSWYRSEYQNLRNAITNFVEPKTQGAKDKVDWALTDLNVLFETRQNLEEIKCKIDTLENEFAGIERMLDSYFTSSSDFGSYKLENYKQLRDSFDLLMKYNSKGLKRLFYRKFVISKEDYDKSYNYIKNNYPKTFSQIKKDTSLAKTELNEIGKKYERYDKLKELSKEEIQKLSKIDESNLVHDYNEIETKLVQNSKEALVQTWFERFCDLSQADFATLDNNKKFFCSEGKQIIIERDKERKALILDTIKNQYKMQPAWATTLLSMHYASPLLPAVFDQVIIDEAAQCDPISIIPALFRAKRACIIGDPQQFKPIINLTTTRNQQLWESVFKDKTQAKRFNLYDSSAYSIMANENNTMLKEHFRCDEGIASYFNDTFYNGLLRVRTHEHKINFPTILENKDSIQWVDVKDSQEEEIKVACDYLMKLYDNFDGTIGVICPFRGIVETIKNELPLNFNNDERVTIDTAYGFQGGEKDVIIFVLGLNSAHSSRGQIWYLTDDENKNIYNVTVSRAVACLIVIGDKEKCEKSDSSVLRSLTYYPKPREKTVKFDSPYEEKFYKALVKAEIPNIQPQFAICGYYLDFAYIDEDCKIDIEVDGKAYHTNLDGSRVRRDFLRNAVLERQGWIVLRFWASELSSNMDECIDKIKATIKHAKNEKLLRK